MSAISRGRLALVAAVLLLACPRAERASVEELYSTRMLGLSYLQRNQLAEAEAEFTKLAKLAPDDPLGFANLGATYLQAGRYADARPTLDRLLRAMETTSPYQAALDEVRWTEGAIPGRPVLTFAPKNFISQQGVRERATVDVAKYVDVTAEVGFPAASPITTLAMGDLDGDGIDDLFAAGAGAASARLFRIQRGAVRAIRAGSR